MKNIEIRKAKLHKDGGLKIEYQVIYEDQEKDLFFISDIEELSSKTPHKDLRLAFDRLRIHLVLLCEQVPAESFEPYEIADNEFQSDNRITNFDVTGLVIGGEDESKGFCLVGRRKLKSNGVINLVSPFQKYEEQSNSYKYLYEAKQEVYNLIAEIKSYLDGKCAPSPQQKLEFPEGTTVTFSKSFQDEAA